MSGLETQIIIWLLGALSGSWVFFFGWLVTGLHRLDRKIDHLADKTDERFDALITRLDQRFEALTIAVSRLEGAVYHGLPEPRKPAVG